VSYRIIDHADKFQLFHLH